MGEVINLNQYRKLQNRQQKELKSAANRIKFGRIKSDREQATAERDGQVRTLEGKKIDPRPTPLHPQNNGPAPKPGAAPNTTGDGA